jgi:hypothetical protein
MRTNWLITTAAIALLASTGIAGAQGMNERGAKSPGPAEKSAPSSQMQGTQPRAAQPSNQTTGQAPQMDRPAQRQGAEPRGAQPRNQTTGQSLPTERPTGSPGQRKGDQMQRQPGTAGQAPDSQRQSRTGADRQQLREGAEQKKGTDAQHKKGTDARTGTETTGRGDSSGASLTNEQRTKIRQVVVTKKIPQLTNVNFTVSVGAKVPRTVSFHPIPVELVEIYPAWRGYQVILVGSELVIVHPASYEIVAVVVV